MAVVFGDEFDGCHGFFFGFVREHGAEGAVTDDADVWQAGAVFLVDHEAAAVVGFEADVLEAEASSVGAAADGDEADITVDLTGRVLVVF